MLSKEMLELYQNAISTFSIVKDPEGFYLICHPDRGFLCVEEDGENKRMAFETILEAEFQCMSMLMGELIPEEAITH